MQVQQNSPTHAVPFFLAVNAGNYQGDPGATPTVQLSKDGAPLVPAMGNVVPAGGGAYWLLGDPRDRDVVGPVMMVITGPSGDIAPPAYYSVVPFNPDIHPQSSSGCCGSGYSASELTTLFNNVASIAADIRVLRNDSVPIQDRA